MTIPNFLKKRIFKMKFITLLVVSMMLSFNAFSDEKRSIETSILEITTLTTTEKNAIAGSEIKLVYDITLNQINYFDGSVWRNLANLTSSQITEATQFASATQNGLLSSADWVTFDGKQNALGFTPEDSANKGSANGYASLDGGGKVPVSQLPNSIMEFQGTWDADTNTSPVLVDGVGNIGDVYRVNVAGTQDLGSGSQTFVVGDWIMYDAGSVWRMAHSGADSVLSVNGLSGIVVLDKNDIGLGNVDNVQQIPFSYLDIDGTLAADSDSKVATQKAVKTYVDAQIGGSGAITEINGLTAVVQSFATGVSGTDYNISSAGSVHTFNLPVASASNTGKLSSTDWSTFNSKEPAITVLSVAKGGTGLSASGVVGNVLTSDGSVWTSSALPDSVDELNGLVATSQTFAVGTSGVDFNISSVGSVHNFNIPTASASNRGALSSADFSSFAAKVDGPASSVDGVIALFDSTTGKLLKEASGTGVAHLTAGVLSVSNVDLASEVTGALPIANGGTGLTSAGTSGYVLTSNGSSFSMQPIPSTFPVIFGTRASPRKVQVAGLTVADGHISNSAVSQDVYVCGSSDGVSCNAAIDATTIDAGTVDGQRLCVIGRDAAAGVTIKSTTTNVEINGNADLKPIRSICFRWDGSLWSEISRNF